MKDFNPIDETAESVEKAAKVAEGRISFIQDFLENKKYGWGIMFFTFLALGVWAAIAAYNKGKKDGKESSIEQITSLNNSLTNRNLEIVTLNNNITNYQKLYEDCKTKSGNLDLEDEVRKALEKSDRLEKILERKIMTTEKQTTEIGQIIQKK